MKQKYQRGTFVEPEADSRKYEIGRMLTFRAYAKDERWSVDFTLPHFKRGDVLRVVRQGCDFAICVRRHGDELRSIVWPEEVSVRRAQRA